MLQHVTLHLARTHEFPDGSQERGYEIVAPLDAADHLDAHQWRSHKAQCRVTRFWAGEAERHGALVHHGGANGGGWAIRYAGQASDSEETGVRLGAHRFAPEEYVSIRDEDGHTNTFKIARLRPVGPAGQNGG